MAYLGALTRRQDVDWRSVQLAHDQWQYKQQGLTPAGAALVAVAVAWAAGPAGAGLLGTSTTPAGLMLDAALGSLATQASITLINNRGNIGNTLKELGSSQVVRATITAALTAGVLDKIGALNSMKALADSTAWQDQLTFNLVNASGQSLTNAAINGGNLGDALREALTTGLVNQVHGMAASRIKGLEGQYVAHKLAHALAGCGAGAAVGGRCADGAIGAAVGEMVAELQDKPGATAGEQEWQAYRANTLALSKITAGAITADAGGNAQTAINSAETAVRNNYLSQRQQAQREAELNNCKDIGCKAAAYAKWAAIDAGQDGSFATGLVAGVPAGLYDSVLGLIHMGMSPLETWEALKGVINSGDILGTVSSAVKQSYLDRIDHMMAEYERAGAGGAFNAGVEGGKLVADLASLAAGGAGITKGGVILTEKVAAKVVVPNKITTPERVVAPNSVGTIFGPHEVGPLGNPNDLRAPASTFRSGSYTEKIAETDMYFYRDYGGRARIDGRYWTPEPSRGPLQSQLDSAVLPEWGNTFSSQAVIKIPAGTKYYEGAAAPQTGTVGIRTLLHGGGTQIFLPNPKLEWIIKQ